MTEDDERLKEIAERHKGVLEMLAKDDGLEPSTLSEWDVLTIVNGWLDDERFAYDLTEKEQVACDVVLGINIRRQREWKMRNDRRHKDRHEYVMGEPCPRCGCKYDRLFPLVLASNPPIPCVQCPDCGWNSYYDKKEEEE